MRDVSEKRQQLEKDHEDALIALQKRQEEVKRLQQAQIDAKKEHEGAVQLLENTLDSLQANVKTLEEKCRTQTEQFSVLSQELERFRLQTGDIGLLTSTLITSDLPPPQCCSTPEVPQVKQDSRDKLPDAFKNHEKTRDSEKERLLPQPPHSKSETKNVEIHNHATSKEKQAMHNSSKSESIQESSKSCPTPEVDTASEMEDIEADSISLNPETENRFPAKLQVFLARYSYNPFDGPNENPEAELPLTAGEYIYIYGDMDEDGFYEGELMDGRRGLVPSNFVERVSDDDLTAFQPAEMNELSQSSGHEIGFISGSSNPRSEEGEDVRSLSPLPCELKGSSEGTPDILAVPYPRKLMLIKQLARSVVVGWEPPQLTASSGNIQSYNIYVDNELRQNVRCGGQTKALIEKLELKTCTYRISVQSMTEHGCSDRMCCTMLIGHGFSLAPTQLRVRCLSATSAEITWQPYNSNCTHALYLNEEACGLAKPGTYWHSFSSLRPCTVYNVKIEAQPKRIPSELPPERREQKTTVIQLTTSSAGPPDAPLDVQVELGPTAGVLLISWLPVTIDAAGSSNGVRVMGYAIYADGQKVLEVTSPTAGSVLIGKSHLQLLHVSKEITVRTMSVSGESIDSVPAQIPSALFNNSDCSSLLPPFYNRLISEPSLEKTLNYCPDKFPSKPVSSFSPCNLPTTLTTCTKAKNSTHATCSRGNLDSLPVQSSPNHMLSPPGASTGYFQGSSSSGSSESSSQKENLQENIHATDHATSISQSIRGSDSTRERSEISKIMLEERASKFQKDLTEGDVTMLESAATISNIEHSRSSTLSDIMEEEEDVEEEENFSITSNKKKTLLGLNDQYDGSAKLECCETDSDEEILERMLALPLQKHCSKKLFSIPEVTEEEDEEEGFEPLIARATMPCKLDSQKYHKAAESTFYSKMNESYSHKQQIKTNKVTNEPWQNESPSKHRKASCASEDCALLSREWQLKQNVCASPQHFDNTKNSLLISPTWNVKRNCYVTEKVNSCPLSNRKMQSDSREQCSRLVVNFSQNLLTLQGRSKKDQIFSYSAKDSACVNQKSIKNNLGCSERAQSYENLEPKKGMQSSCDSKNLEIDIEYDTENEEEPSVPFHCVNHTATNIWEDSSQTDRDGWSDCSSQSEQIQYSKKRRALKRQINIQDNGIEIPRNMSSDVHCQNIQQDSRIDNQYRRKTHVPATGWGCSGEDCWNGDNSVTSIPDLPELLSGRHFGSNQTSGSESEATFYTLPDHQHSVALNEEQSTFKSQTNMARIFVALFEYDPATMSPNPDSYEEELPFKEGQILKVFGDKDPDGFYHGECEGKMGFIPCNMVSELKIHSEDVRAELLQNGWVTSPSELNDLVEVKPVLDVPNSPEKSKKTNVHDFSTARSMVAIFDYNPKESSPNMDVEAELSFTAGDIITIFGPMDEDGFYYGELNGKRGLVPSNFLENAPYDIEELNPQEALNSRENIELGSELSFDHPESPTEDADFWDQAANSKTTCERQNLHEGATSSKKKKSFFSKGKKLFKKLGKNL